MNSSHEPPRPRHRDPGPTDFEYQYPIGVPSCSPPEYRQQDGYFVKNYDGRFSKLERTPRVKTRRPEQRRGDSYRQNQPADDCQRGELAQSFQSSTKPPTEQSKIRDVPRHRVKVRAVERPDSWRGGEAITVDTTRCAEPEAKVPNVPRIDLMAESSPAEDRRKLRTMLLTPEECMLIGDYRENEREEQRRNMYQHADAVRTPRGAPESSRDLVSKFYASRLRSTSDPGNPVSSERGNRSVRRPKGSRTRSNSSTGSLSSFAEWMSHLF
ncbi:unnamed protein product [Clonostachys rosea]|uniref:Uncharacterized protein n=1 Tax=Bionectria ochroleuca TaxID=29856 RepID=A0ABY6UWN1_BIOOC|nr:unnamed protein product [Clonostachys rosea]